MKNWREGWIGRVLNIHSASAHFLNRCWCQTSQTSEDLRVAVSNQRAFIAETKRLISFPKGYKPVGADMEALPDVPTHFVRVADRTEVCPVHQRKHGWYVCFPNDDDLTGG